jgi:hypothetical protein
VTLQQLWLEYRDAGQPFKTMPLPSTWPGADRCPYSRPIHTADEASSVELTGRLGQAVWALDTSWMSMTERCAAIA